MDGDDYTYERVDAVDKVDYMDRLRSVCQVAIDQYDREMSRGNVSERTMSAYVDALRTMVMAEQGERFEARQARLEAQIERQTVAMARMAVSMTGCEL